MNFDVKISHENKNLTHVASFLWDIGKQYSPRCDKVEAEQGVPSGAILFA